jgi:hypothetical protein
MTIGQALAKTWTEEKKKDTEYRKMKPLMSYLEFNYKERYVALCQRCGVEPISLGKWLLRPAESI